MISLTHTVEMQLLVPLTDQSGNILTDPSGGTLVATGWKDVTNDILLEPTLNWTRGNSGRTVSDRVSNIGSFNFVLNNSEVNEARTAGYYSPDHGNVVSTFGLDTEVRLTFTQGTLTYQEWQGKISNINPSFGQYRDRRTAITCEDWMANAYRDTIRGITVQTDKRDDEILTTLLALASTPTITTDFSTGDDTYAYSLHDENSLTSTLSRVFQKLAMSGFGRIYLTNYSTLVYRSRSELLLAGSPAATLTDSMIDLRVRRDKSQRVKEVLVTTYPAQLDSSAAVLWESQREREIAATETVEFDISFRDPSGRATRVAATSLTAPVADTDYKFSSVSGSGNDLNGQLSITVTLKADIATVRLTNNAGSTGYLWFHQQRGTGVYLYEPVTSYAATGQADGETLSIDMVYQDDPAVGEDIKTLVAAWSVTDQSDVESITFLANSSQALMDAAFLTPGELITIYETQTGIASSFIINGTAKTLLPGGILQVIWYPTYANQISNACRLDVEGLAELDDTAILGA